MVLSLIADDLSSACDSASLFAGGGPIPVTVWPVVAGAGAVSVVDTESRTVDAGEAARRIATVAGDRSRTARHFKQIDATLAGHVGVEMTALMRAIGAKSALLTPAFPAQGATVLDRTLLIDGVSLTETTRASGPEFPRSATANVVEALRADLDFPLAWVPIEQVRAGVDPLAARLRRLAGTVAIADAETDEDLALLVAAALALDVPPVLAGTAAFAQPLAARLGMAAEAMPLPRGGRWLVVAGRRHAGPRRQAAAREAARLLDDEAFDLVVVTGGEMALALYQALGAERLDIVGAPERGVALGYLRSARHPALPVLIDAAGKGIDADSSSETIEVAVTTGRKR